MAPEVVANEKLRHLMLPPGQGAQEYGFAADVWAVGIFMLTLLEGRSPFSSKDQ